MLLDFGRRSSRRRRSGGMDDTGEPEEGEVMHGTVGSDAGSSSGGGSVGVGDGGGGGSGGGGGGGGGGGDGGLAVPELMRQSTPHGGTILTTVGSRSAPDISFTDGQTHRSLYRVLRAVEYMHAIEHCPMLVSLAKLCYLVLDDLHAAAEARLASGRGSVTEEFFDREACTYEILTKGN